MTICEVALFSNMQDLASIGSPFVSSLSHGPTISGVDPLANRATGYGFNDLAAVDFYESLPATVNSWRIDLG